MNVKIIVEINDREGGVVQKTVCGTKALAKRVCQLAPVDHYTRLEQLMAGQHGVHLGHEEMAQVVH